MPTISNSSPQLAPPGAGLPKPELFGANLIFRFSLWRSNREKAMANFELRREEILLLAQTCDQTGGDERVLIPRLPGLEDSSRYWSIFMTLDHLRIVNRSITDTIASLLAGQVPPRPVSTADVKPSETADESVVAAFEESCQELESLIAQTPNLATEVRYAHPWFGPLDAAAWHFMAGFHMNLHRQQIERILAGRKNGHC